MGMNEKAPAEIARLRRKQLDAEQAWEYLQSKGVANLDIERPGKDKVTLTELLAEFANGVYIGREEAVRAPESAEQIAADLCAELVNADPLIYAPDSVKKTAKRIEAYVAERVAALNQRIKELEAQILASAPGARAREEELRDRLLTTERRAEADLAEAHQTIARYRAALEIADADGTKAKKTRLAVEAALRGGIQEEGK